MRAAGIAIIAALLGWTALLFWAVESVTFDCITDTECELVTSNLPGAQ